LRATAITRNTDGNDWGKLFSLKDPAGEEKQLHMRNAVLAASPSAVISDLIDDGCCWRALRRHSSSGRP